MASAGSGAGATGSNGSSTKGDASGDSFLTTKNVIIGVCVCGAMLGQVLSAKYGKRFLGAEFVKASKDVTKNVYGKGAPPPPSAKK